MFGVVVLTCVALFPLPAELCVQPVYLLRNVSGGDVWGLHHILRYDHPSVQLGQELRTRHLQNYSHQVSSERDTDRRDRYGWGGGGKLPWP